MSWMRVLAPLLMLVMHTALATAQNIDAPDAGDDGWQLRWRDHPEVMWGDLLRVSLRANLQLDTRRSDMALERDGDSFDVGRRRLALHGRIGPRLGFEVEREFASSEPWRDVFVSYEATRTLAVRAGRFKLPFGLEETTGGSRPGGTQASLSRDDWAPNASATKPASSHTTATTRGPGTPRASSAIARRPPALSLNPSASRTACSVASRSVRR